MRAGPATLSRPDGGASACRVSRSEEQLLSHGKDRSQSRDHARLHRVQAAQLPDDQVEAEHARPRGVQEVLPLVRGAHAAPGDPLGMATRGRSAGAERRLRRPRAEVARRRPARSRSAAIGASSRVVGRAQEGRVAEPEPGRSRARSSCSSPAPSSASTLAQRPGLEGSRPEAVPRAVKGAQQCFAGTSSTPTRATRTRSRPTSSTGSSRWASARASAASSSRPSR